MMAWLRRFWRSLPRGWDQARPIWPNSPHEHVYRCQYCGEIGRGPADPESSHPSASESTDRAHILARIGELQHDEEFRTRLAETLKQDADLIDRLAAHDDVTDVCGFQGCVLPAGHKPLPHAKAVSDASESTERTQLCRSCGEPGFPNCHDAERCCAGCTHTSDDDAASEPAGSTLTRPKFGADGSITNLDELPPPVPSGVDESAWCSRCGHSIGMHDEGPCRGIVDRGEGDEVNCSCHGMEFKPASDSATDEHTQSSFLPGDRVTIARNVADGCARWIDRHGHTPEPEDVFAITLAALTGWEHDKASVETEAQR